MNIVMFIELMLFALGVAEKVSFIILALVAVKLCNHFIPAKESRLLAALKAAKAEIFAKR